MKLRDEAWVLDCTRFGETKFILTTLSHSNGIIKGLVRGKSSNYQCGDYITLEWSARLPHSHLGNINSERLSRAYGKILDNGAKLAALRSAACLLATLLPLQVPNPKGFEAFGGLVKALSHPQWATSYVCWELDLLANVGYAMDLSRCALSNSTTLPLEYVSPKTGRGASKEALASKEVDKAKLLKLPQFLYAYATNGAQDGNQPAQEGEQIKQGLRLTGHFLEIALHGKTIPPRNLLLELL